MNLLAHRALRTVAERSRRARVRPGVGTRLRAELPRTAVEGRAG